MRFKTLIFIMFLWITFSCGNNTSSSSEALKGSPIRKASTEDYRIINSTFPHLVEIMSPLSATREFGYDNFNPKGKQIPEEHLIDVYFTNALVPFNDTSVFDPRPEERSITMGDTTHQRLYHDLFSNEQTESRIETSFVTNTRLFRLKPVQKDQKVALEIAERLITYSTINYNADKTKAVFYIQNTCAGLCGFGMFVFVEKVNGIWKIANASYIAWES